MYDDIISIYIYSYIIDIENCTIMYTLLKPVFFLNKEQ